MAKWLGPGVYSFGGKDYKVGEEMPKGVDEDTLTALTRKGKVGEIVAAAPAAPDNRLDDALAQIGELSAQVAAEQARVVALTAENDDLATQLVQAQKTITEMTNAAMNTAGPKVKEGK